MQERYLGYIQLILAQTGVGLGIVTGKKMLSLGVPVYMQVELRFLLSFFILLSFLMIKARRAREDFELIPKISKRDWTLVIMQAVCAGVLFNILMLFGLKYTTATMAGIITSALPVVIAILSFVFLKERLSRNKILAIILVVIGVSILHIDTIGSSTAQSPIIGGVLVGLALLPEGLYTIFSKILGKKIDPLVQATWINLISCLLFLPFWIFSGMWNAMDIIDLKAAGFIVLGSFASMLFYYFWTAGVTHVKATTAAIFTGVMPIVTTIAAILMLHESFSIFDLLGMAFVLASIFIGTYRRNSKKGACT